VAIPSLFGEPGRGKDPGYVIFDHRPRLCGKGIRGFRDQQAAAGVGLFAGVGPRPQQGGRRVRASVVIGECSPVDSRWPAAVDDAVLAPVLSQPSVPFR